MLEMEQVGWQFLSISKQECHLLKGLRPERRLATPAGWIEIGCISGTSSSVSTGVCKTSSTVNTEEVQNISFILIICVNLVFIAYRCNSFFLPLNSRFDPLALFKELAR